MMSAPLVGHLDPLFVRTMDEVQTLLRYVFETNNRLTIPVSGTGSAGMEAAVVNLVEPGEEIVVCINGYFGSWYLDASLLTAYWGETSGGGRAYHHTAPITMNYALHEALRIVAEEGLENRARRHERNHRALVAGVEAMGLRMAVAPDDRLWTLNAVRIPDGVDDLKVRNRLLNEFDIEIGGGLGVFKGKVWRVGLMGAGSTENNVLLLLGVLEKALRDEGFKVKDSGVSAAAAFYAEK
ncbi:MAG: pyridoxal-phosphate-dependent aminotransferase family protein [Blastocatellia bacterium]